MAYQYALRPDAEGTLDEALGLHRLFFGREPDRIERTRLDSTRTPRVLVELGELRALVYSAERGDGSSKPRSYVHFFERPPRLLSDEDGRRLFISGGGFRVTRRGIEG